MSAEDKNHNRESLLQNIISDHLDEEKHHQKTEEKRVRLQKTRKIVSSFLKLTSFLTAFIFIIYLGVLIAHELYAYSYLKPWVIGELHPTDPKLRECLFEMWKIRKALDQAYADKKEFPINIEALYRKGYLEEKRACPVSGIEYFLGRENKEKVFQCPNPEKHKVSNVYSRWRGGPPQIER